MLEELLFMMILHDAHGIVPGSRVSSSRAMHQSCSVVHLLALTMTLTLQCSALRTITSTSIELAHARSALDNSGEAWAEAALATSVAKYNGTCLERHLRVHPFPALPACESGPTDTPPGG